MSVNITRHSESALIINITGEVGGNNKSSFTNQINKVVIDDGKLKVYYISKGEPELVYSDTITGDINLVVHGVAIYKSKAEYDAVMKKHVIMMMCMIAVFALTLGILSFIIIGG